MAHVIVPGNVASVGVVEKIGSRFIREMADVETGRKRLIYGQGKSGDISF